MSRFLGTQDLAALTKRTKYTAQKRRLQQLGIRFIDDPEGPIVTWDDVNNRGTTQAATTQHEPEPNFDALLRGKKTS